MSFPIHSIETAPEEAKETLLHVQKTIGLIPNLAATMSESPALVKGFFALREILSKQGTFTDAELQVLFLTNAFENGCEYCMALHSTHAVAAGVSKGSVNALRAGNAALEPRLKVLSDLSRKLVKERGRINEQDLKSFYDAGFTRAQALEVVLGVAVSTMPNFAHHLTHAPLDDVFKAQAWTGPSK